MNLVFLGPDGVGKSTVIEAVFNKLKRKDVPYTYHYLVPGYLPRYKNVNNGEPVVNPHDVIIHGKFKSFVKLIFWMAEYCLGVRKLNKEPKIRVFDRYFYDILIDPKRYCYGGSYFLAKLVSRLVPKPDILIILDAPTETIQSRKQEVPFEETSRQRREYAKLVNVYCKSIVLDTTDDIEHNSSIIVREIG